MRKIGAVLCLLLITVDGRLEDSRPLARAAFLARPDRTALTATLASAGAAFRAYLYDEAERIFTRGYRSALQAGDSEMAARFLCGLGNCQIVRFRYKDALESYLSARQHLTMTSDPERVASVEIGLASLYSQLGEYDAATEAARRALAATPRREPLGNRARELILLANLELNRGQGEQAWPLFREGIAEADRYGDPDLLSNAWDKLGAGLLLRKKLPEAEQALLEAYRIRKLNRLPSLGWSYRNVGMLRLAQGDLRSASALLDAAMAESRAGRGRIPEWRFYQSRGTARLAAGDVTAAHADFRLALELVRNYRLATPASDATRVSLEEFVEQVYASFVETGSRLYMESGRGELARETFEAAEENRAGSLAARLTERVEWRRNLPASYWEALGRLEAAESDAALRGERGSVQAMRRIRASLIEMEARSGTARFAAAGDVLARVRRSLDGDTALFTFHLGATGSCLWAVSRSGLALYRLPDRDAVTRAAAEFRLAVAENRGDAERLGRRLYGMLFGSLGAEYRRKTRWLLSLDSGLFDVPFAALVAGGPCGAPVYLVEWHSLRSVSGASVWADRGARRGAEAGSFVGVGDAIYNMADARWRGPAPEPPGLLRQAGWPWKASAAAPAELSLGRLAGSGAEIESCAREWGGRSQLFEGRDATKENVRRALAGRPAVLHFATHVLDQPAEPAGGLIALSVARNGRAELLGASEIEGWTAEAGLIVLSGCSSGAAAAHPATGLMGLTRAWLMAGARAVVATGWRTPDDVGVFFQRFYRKLRSPEGRDPAEALRAAQIETIRARDWRSEPAFWSAYFALGNY